MGAHLGWQAKVAQAREWQGHMAQYALALDDVRQKGSEDHVPASRARIGKCAKPSHML